MAVIQIRDVPDEVAAVLAEKAAARHQSLSAYLRGLLAADAEAELRRRAAREWHEKLRRIQAGLDFSRVVAGDATQAVRETRHEREAQVAERVTLNPGE